MLGVLVRLLPAGDPRWLDVVDALSWDAHWALDHRADSLTDREREVARLAADGLSAREIGAALFIGERTVEGHLARAYARLGVRSKVELARRAADFGLRAAPTRTATPDPTVPNS